MTEKNQEQEQYDAFHLTEIPELDQRDNDIHYYILEYGAKTITLKPGDIIYIWGRRKTKGKTTLNPKRNSTPRVFAGIEKITLSSGEIVTALKTRRIYKKKCTCCGRILHTFYHEHVVNYSIYKLDREYTFKLNYKNLDISRLL